MGERDAFGREKGEDTLAEMGWSWTTDAPAATPATPVASAAATPVTPEPTFTAAPTPTPTPPPAMSAGAPTGPAWTPAAPATVRLRRRRRTRGIIVPLVLIGFVAVAIGGATTALQAGSGALDDLEGAIRNAVPETALTPTAPPPAGLESGSLYRPAALQAALDKLPKGDLESLRVAPDRINAQVIVDGKMHVVQVDSAGEVSDVQTPASGRGESLRADNGAPNRIVRTAARRAGRDPARVSYLVLMSFSGKGEWQLFFDDGLHYSASANGRKVRRVG